jgi:GNAT superfamily N-acetyltransferase
MEIREFEPGRDGWDAYVAHLRRAGDARWVLGDDGRPLAGVHCLGAVVDGNVVGDLAVREQVVTAPATKWSGGAPRPLEAADGTPLRETYVMSFAVAETHRRRGIGCALQTAALDLTRRRGCCQMRSWSSLDKPENYGLKLSMGFAMHPEVHEAWNGTEVSGVYFVKRVD